MYSETVKTANKTRKTNFCELLRILLMTVAYAKNGRLAKVKSESPFQ